MKKMKLLVLTLAVAMGPGLAGAHDIEAWNSPVPEQPDHVLIRNATVWTADEAGILENTDILIRRGEIRRIGEDLRAPRGSVEIDAEGRHVTPGLIDAHSHAAMLGGVNEMSLISTAMVEARDIVDADSINIYRQMAGGLTTMHLMHGSANAIGGQNVIAKLRWGADPADMIIDDAPGTIKFALGENPKQSNWQPDTLRYPQTRHGVAQVIDEKFQMARDYAEQHEAHTGRAARNRVPPRRDLEMEALVAILEGDIEVHSHGYRADEFLALMRTAEAHDFRIKAFHHVLEGYKVADEIAEHGAGASTFSDWWGFKYEARDAIPYNAALMHDRGVQVSINSDNPELARRMNLEVAKAVRYGNMDEHEALKMVTANAADQLGIGHRTGRLREGLDADLVIWSDHPLSVYSRPDQTWIDGRAYFDRERDLQQREAWEAERQELIALVRESENGEDDDEEQADDDEVPDEDEPGMQVFRQIMGGA
ncbi:amidohydrolase family protein [Wenzhouxiangella sp. AB-CW3]|uniref:amidohydrolase family protein n=1 Tax=Wenzhouxiangella sp. AB-CW3 TaxID=2771012 RepID=UPI00168BE6A3|nr:amidohydrolase family protein [Wenzhouxiangella sp. AB-CW3]QOC23925.1 amidohydrolase family protein [Wenzhouxiangella sp. AB-CW3]